LALIRFVLIACLAVLGLGRPVSAGEVTVTARQGRFNLRAEAAPLNEVVAAIGAKAHLDVTYDTSAPRPPVTIALSSTPLEEVLKALFDSQPVEYSVKRDARQRVVGIQVKAKASVGATAPATGPAAPTAAAPLSPEEYVKRHVGGAAAPSGAPTPPISMPPGMRAGPPVGTGTAPPVPKPASPASPGSPGPNGIAYPPGMRPGPPPEGSQLKPPAPFGPIKDGRTPPAARPGPAVSPSPSPSPTASPTAKP
jgi:hypothetical protein